MEKPRIFIASSAESLPVAEAVNVNLDHDFEVTLWRTGTFKLSSTTIDDLLKKASAVDFALFVFTPDDIVKIRGESGRVTRDNVVFELGLFIGSIGKERCFILSPRNQKLHLPSDLIGLNAADFEPNRFDGELTSATSAACTLIKERSKELGLVSHIALTEQQRFLANPQDYPLKKHDWEFLSACLESQTSQPGGLPFHTICRDLKRIENSLLRISAVKLERLKLIEKSIQFDPDSHYEYFSYSITELGIDYLLHKEPDFNDKDDIPF